MCCISGILFIALPIPTIVSNFSAFYKDHLNKGKLQKLYETLHEDIGTGSDASVLISSTDTLYNVATLPAKRVSISAIERHETYRRRLSTVSGLAMSLPMGVTKIQPINEDEDDSIPF